MRIMGLDYGSKTVGVAVCDPLGITAQTVETITRKDENKLRQTLARIEALALEYGVERIVLGYPKNMNNTLGDRAKKSEELKEALERRTGLPVVLWDERLTTVAAERVLMESGVRREHRKESVDQIAAAMILQGYLDRMAMEQKKDCITMVTEDGDEVVFSVLEETRIHGKDYLLVTDAPEDEDGECYILKDVSGEQEPDAVYEFVEDDRELDSVMGIFEALLSDADVEIEK